jgi:hypothetical protein
MENYFRSIMADIKNLMGRVSKLEAQENMIDYGPTFPTTNVYNGRKFIITGSGRMYEFDSSINYGGMWKGALSDVFPLAYAPGAVAMPWTTAAFPAAPHTYNAQFTGVSHMWFETFRTHFFSQGVVSGANFWKLDFNLANVSNQAWALGTANNSAGATNQWTKPGLTQNMVVPVNQWGALYTALSFTGAPGNLFLSAPTLLARELGNLPPQDVGGITAWWRADVPCRILTTGGAMSYWGEGGSSAGLTNAQQATGANQPTWNTGVHATYPVASFDGTNDYMLVDNPATNPFNLGAFTIFVVAKSLGSGTSGTLETIFGKGDASLAVGNAGRRKLQIGRSGANLRISSGADTQFIDTPLDWTTGFHAACWVANSASNHNIYVDSNAVVNSATTLDLATTNTVQPTIGQSFSTGLTEDWNGPIGEIIIHNSALSAANVALIMAYLKAKWGTP